MSSRRIWSRDDARRASPWRFAALEGRDQGSTPPEPDARDGVSPPGLAAGEAAHTATGRGALQWPTADELEAIRSAAESEGYRAGREQASVEARRLASVADMLEESARRIEDELADRVLELAIDVARAVTRVTLRQHPEAIVEVVGEAMALLPQTVHHLAINLHPDDAELVSRHLADHPLSHPCRVRANASLTPGGALISSDEADLDATVETRWRRVLETLDRNDAWDPDAATQSPPQATSARAGRRDRPSPATASSPDPAER